MLPGQQTVKSTFQMIGWGLGGCDLILQNHSLYKVKLYELNNFLNEIRLASYKNADVTSSDFFLTRNDSTMYYTAGLGFMQK